MLSRILIYNNDNVAILTPAYANLSILNLL